MCTVVKRQVIDFLGVQVLLLRTQPKNGCQSPVQWNSASSRLDVDSGEPVTIYFGAIAIIRGVVHHKFVGCLVFKLLTHEKAKAETVISNAYRG